MVADVILITSKVQPTMLEFIRLKNYEKGKKYETTRPSEI